MTGGWIVFMAITFVLVMISVLVWAAIAINRIANDEEHEDD